MRPEDTVVADTRRWLERAVIGLNLCPFAKGVLVKEQVHFCVCFEDDASQALEALEREARELLALPASERDTSLLMLPGGFDDFLEFQSLATRAERLLRKRGWEGELQVAHFHPRFEFAGADPGDITHCTNRAPYPTLHLLREASVDRAVAAFPEAADIYEANMETLRRLGAAGWEELGVGRSA
jgi:hypothetical protein